MDHLSQLLNKVRQRSLILIFVENIAVIALLWAANRYTSINFITVSIIAMIVGLFLAFIISINIAQYSIIPLRAVWQAVLHLAPSGQNVAAPRIDNLKVGRELVTSLTNQIYQLAAEAGEATDINVKQRLDITHNYIAQSLPLPFFALDVNENIKFANEAAAKYIGIPVSDLIAKNIYMVLDMSFPNEDTFDKWLKDVKLHSATASNTWERVRLNVRDNHPTLLFDLASYYNRGNADQIETMLVLFDHTKQYSQDDQAISFIALSVHELRTPLTLLRGYIEVIEEELEDKVSPELLSFMLKMRTQAEQLMAFVNNILNVARIDNDQLELRLQEGNWQMILSQAIETLRLRAKVRGIELELEIAPDLPSVAVDSLSIVEVINNLIDNAVKYSGNGKIIKINSHLGREDMIETTVQDFGLGISASIMPNLFTKFYRDHHNRAQIGGTGLGLYLSKAIITAHGGNMWVNSKEGQGTIFGFSLLPYSRLAEEQKQTGDKEIVRNAHGWIKNHSLYRR